MKKVLVLCSVMLLLASTVFAASFAPAVMKMNAPTAVKYDFDGKQFTLPVTVTGAPATAIFCVYTKDKGSTIKNVINGYLGWHHVNNIDTSVYIANAVNLSTGSNTIYWDGKDDDGNKVPAGSYTYYVFGYDGTSGKQLVQATIMNSGGSGGKLAHIQEWGADGKALTNPIWYSRGFGVKWVIG